MFYFARISWSDKPDGRGLSSSEKCKLHMKTLESLLVLCETKKSHLLLLWVSVLTLFHKLLQYRAVGSGGPGAMALQILADQLTLFKPRGQIMPTTIQRTPPRILEVPTALQIWWLKVQFCNRHFFFSKWIWHSALYNFLFSFNSYEMR